MNIDAKGQVKRSSFFKGIIKSAARLTYDEMQSIVVDKNISINILAVIDDDENKLGHSLVNTNIISLKGINDIKHDGILISSHTNKSTILNKLISIEYDEKRILNFFEI